MLNPYTQEPAHVGGGPEGFGFDRFLRAFFDRSQLVSLEKPLASAQSAVWALFFVNVRSRENLAEIPHLPSWNKTVFVVMGKKNRKYFAIARYRLRWFSFLLLALWANLVTAQTGQNSSIYRRASAPIATPSREQEIAGSEISAIAASDQAGRAERMVTASLAGLARAESIQARIRQRVVFSGRLIVGAGTYVQSGIGSEQRFRFESTLKGDTEQFVLQEISDGIVFWTYRKNSTDAPSIERIDIRRVRSQLEKLLNVKQRDMPAVSAYMGGIQRTLALVREWFLFTSATAELLDGVPVWKIDGRWNPEKLAVLLPDKAETIRSEQGLSPEAMPETMPHTVRLILGQRDLFPFRIELFSLQKESHALEQMSLFELFDVRIGDPVDASAFVYRPAATGLIDYTESYVNQVVPLRP
jgi:outer membrane lipoprotein-sorting protein